MQVNHSSNFLASKYSKKSKQQTRDKYKSVIFLTKRIASLSSIDNLNTHTELRLQHSQNESHNNKIDLHAANRSGKYRKQDSKLSQQQKQYKMHIGTQVQRQTKLIVNQLSVQQKIKALRRPVYKQNISHNNSKKDILNKNRKNKTLTSTYMDTRSKGTVLTSRPNMTQRQHKTGYMKGSQVQLMRRIGTYQNTPLKIKDKYRQVRNKTQMKWKTTMSDQNQQANQFQFVNANVGDQMGVIRIEHYDDYLASERSRIKQNQREGSRKQISQQQRTKMRQRLKRQPATNRKPNNRKESSQKRPQHKQTQKCRQAQKQACGQSSYYVNQSRSICNNESRIDGQNDNRELDGEMNIKFERNDNGKQIKMDLSRSMKNKDLSIISNLSKYDYEVREYLNAQISSNNQNHNGSNNNNSNNTNNSDASQLQNNEQCSAQYNLNQQKRNRLRESYQKYYNKLLQSWHEDHDQQLPECQCEQNEQGGYDNALSNNRKKARQGKTKSKKENIHGISNIMIKDKDNKFLIPKNGLYVSMYMRMHNLELKYPVNLNPATQTNPNQDSQAANHNKSYKEMVISTQTNMGKYLSKRYKNYNVLRNSKKKFINNYSYTQIHSMFKSISPRHKSIQNINGCNEQKPIRTNNPNESKGDNEQGSNESNYPNDSKQNDGREGGQQNEVKRMEGSIMIGEEEVGLNGKGYKRMSNAHNVSRNMKKNKAHFANLDRYRKKGSIHNMNSNNSNKGSIDYSHNSYNNRKVFVELVGPTIKIDPW